LQEAVQPFVHPSPLALIRVDDHREPVVTDLVNDHANQTVLGTRRVSAIGFGPRTIEADHRVLHAAADDAIDRNRGWVWIRESHPAIHIERMRDGVR